MVLLPCQSKDYVFLLMQLLPTKFSFPKLFSINIFEMKLLVYKAKNEINAHKNLVGLALDICEGQTKFILNTSNLFQIKIL